MRNACNIQAEQQPMVATEDQVGVGVDSLKQPFQPAHWGRGELDNNNHPWEQPPIAGQAWLPVHVLPEGAVGDHPAVYDLCRGDQGAVVHSGWVEFGEDADDAVQVAVESGEDRDQEDE